MSTIPNGWSFEEHFLIDSIELGDFVSGSLKGLVKADRSVVTTQDARRNDIDANTTAECGFPEEVTVLQHGQQVTVFRQSIRLKHVGDGLFKATARYGQNEPRTGTRPDGGSDGSGNSHDRTCFDISFNVGTHTRTVRQAKRHSAFFPAAGVVVDPLDPCFGFGQLNVQGDEVVGLDVEFPIASFSETHYINRVVTGPDIKNFYQFVGSVNSVDFRDCSAGELLLRSAQGRKVNNEQWQITYEWGYQPNQVQVEVSGILVDALGWDYVHPRYGKEISMCNERVIPKLLGFSVDEIYCREDHNQLPGCDLA